MVKTNLKSTKALLTLRFGKFLIQREDQVANKSKHESCKFSQAMVFPIRRHIKKFSFWPRIRDDTECNLRIPCKVIFKHVACVFVVCVYETLNNIKQSKTRKMPTSINKDQST